ncbi:MAG: hypothetical protein LAQ69_19430 [Acidobacteriia bacterium]|nr:hypothetical protein [Terriglobia bacterium]
MNPSGISRWFSIAVLLALLLTLSTRALPQTTPAGRLDFLKSKDPSFALFANTSAGGQPGKQYPDELVLLTGLPASPTISARMDLLGANKPKCPGTCGGLRNVVLSPDGDTALVTSDPHDNLVSSLFLLRNIRAFARGKNPGDLQVHVFTDKDVPQLHSVSGLAFGPDGRWAVVNTAGPGQIDGSYKNPKGTVVVITGLPDNPVFSAPFSVPMHSQGNIDLSLDGGTLLLNDTTDFSGIVGGGPKSDQIVVRGIRPGGSPRVTGTSTFATPQEFPPGPTPVRDARLTLDGRFILAPVDLIREIDTQQTLVGVNQIAILGPVRNGKLETARLLTEADGVSGGPFQAGVSPDGDSALVTNVLDSGGAKLITGLSSGDPAQFRLKPLPFQFFGPPFPLGATGPAVLAPHGQVVFTPDGETALVANWITPPVAGTAVTPSLSVLTGFQSGNIHLAANLSDPTFNPIDQRQQIATSPAGLIDYINLYAPVGDARNNLMSLLNDAIARSDRGEPNDAVVDQLMRFIRAAYALGRSGVLTRSRTATLVTLATVGIQVFIGRAENVNAAGFGPGSVAPDSIASLFGEGLGTSQAASTSRPIPTTLAGTTVTVIDSAGTERPAPLFMVSPGQINYLVPSGTAAGKATAVVSAGGRVTGIATVDIDPISPGVFRASPGGYAAALVTRVKPDGSQSVEVFTGVIDLGPPTDQVYLSLFGTGIRGRSGLAAVTARWESPEASGEAAVTFAGAQGEFDGLDQVNLLLPRRLEGLGGVTFALTIDGWDSNTGIVIVR